MGVCAHICVCGEVCLSAGCVPVLGQELWRQQAEGSLQCLALRMLCVFALQWSVACIVCPVSFIHSTNGHSALCQVLQDQGIVATTDGGRLEANDVASVSEKCLFGFVFLLCVFFCNRVSLCSPCWP